MKPKRQYPNVHMVVILQKQAGGTPARELIRRHAISGGCEGPVTSLPPEEAV